MNKKVVIGVPVYNGSANVVQALDALLGQTFSEFSVIILDDGSSDGSYEILESYQKKDSRIVLYRNEIRSGMVGAWRKLALAAGEIGADYFAWYADHDWVESNWLEVLYNKLENNENVVLAYPETYKYEPDGTLNKIEFKLDTLNLNFMDSVGVVAHGYFSAGEAIYGLFRYDVLVQAGIFPYELMPDRLIVSEMVNYGKIAYCSDTRRYRRNLTPDDYKSVFIQRQQRMLFPDNHSMGTATVINHAVYFLSKSLNENASYKNIIHAMYYLAVMVARKRKRIESEYDDFAGRCTDSRVLEIVRHILHSDWEFLDDKHTCSSWCIKSTLIRLIKIYTNAMQTCTHFNEIEENVVVKMKDCDVDTPFLSIIICTYNRADFLRKCIDELTLQIGEYSSLVEVLVIDNNCLDNTADMVAELRMRHPWLKYFKETKQGLSNARNCGAENAEGVYLCYLDDDGYPCENYIENLIKLLLGEFPDLAGGPVYPYYTTAKPLWFKDKYEIRCYAKESGYSTECLVSGGNYVIRKDILERLGMFSADYGMIGGKVRLGEERAVLEAYRKMIPAGKQRVYYSLECFIYHYVPQEKMKRWYFISRGFHSGRSGWRIKYKSDRQIIGVARTFLHDLFVSVPFVMLNINKEKNLLEITRELFINLGKISAFTEDLWKRLR